MAATPDAPGGAAAAAAAAAAPSDGSAAALEAAVARGEAPRDFDKAQFDATVVVPAIRVPCRAVQGLLKDLRSLLLDLPRTRNVVYADDDAEARLILLQPGTGTPSSSSDAGDDAARLPAATVAAVAEVGGTYCTHAVTVGYEQLSSDVILRRLLPASIRDVPSGMEMAGKLGHLNLRDEQFPYRYVIGRVLLDKNPALRTIVAKTGVIETTFRTFPMEVIAGDGDTNVEVRHAGATFRFDFKTVYWNSRLATEHEHIAAAIPRAAIVADMFCGVGPFAIPLARAPSCCRVYANDLTPASYAALVDNARRNKVSGGVLASNEDGRAFIRRLVTAGIPFAHVLMNLPADAISFLDTFVGVYASHPAAAADASARAAIPMPSIHTYCFSRGATLEDAQLDVTARVLAVLGLAPPPPPQPAAGSITPTADAAAAAATRAAAAASLPDLVVREVRDVAPNKLMLCAEFTLPPAVAFAAAGGAGGGAGGSGGRGGGSGGGDGGSEEGDGAAAAPAAKRGRIE